MQKILPPSVWGEMFPKPAERKYITWDQNHGGCWMKTREWNVFSSITNVWPNGVCFYLGCWSWIWLDVASLYSVFFAFIFLPNSIVCFTQKLKRSYFNNVLVKQNISKTSKGNKTCNKNTAWQSFSQPNQSSLTAFHAFCCCRNWLL